MFKILVVGAVQTTKHTINQLLKYDFNIVGVLGHEPANVAKVSGWFDLKTFSSNEKLPYKGFKNISDQENLDWATEKQPDVIFAVGLSQLMSQSWLEMPKFGCIGFHPSHLPKGRGRAPLAWIVLEQATGSASFFLMGEGADDGPIFVQKTFEIEQNDDAASAECKIEKAIIESLDIWLPKLKTGEWNPVPQEELEASWCGKRAPEDGRISWENSAHSIDRLIKASSHPHPGSYTYFKDSKIAIWKSSIERNIPIQGVIGRVLLIDSIKGYLIQCGEGLIWLEDIDLPSDTKLQVGDKLGYNVEDEIFQIKLILKSLSHE
jgi:methionyl-tRNA formyltransferase